MKVKIEFSTQCLHCLYETPDSKIMTWENNVEIDSDSNIDFSEEDIAIMLNQLHTYNGIVCENCGQGDKLGFAIEKVNDKPFGDPDIDNIDHGFVVESGSKNDFDIHNDILKFARSGFIIFILKSGKAKIGKLDGVYTDHSNGEKSYSTKVYYDIEDIDNDEFIFDVEDGYYFDKIYLKDIKEVEYFQI